MQKIITFSGHKQSGKTTAVRLSKSKKWIIAEEDYFCETMIIVCVDCEAELIGSMFKPLPKICPKCKNRSE